MRQPLPITQATGGYALEAYGLEPRIPEVFSASSISDFMTCESLFYLRKILRRKVRGPEAPHFAYGRVWHQAQYAYNGQEDPGLGLKAALDRISDIFPTDILNETDAKGRTKNRMITMFAKYLEKYGSADLEHQQTLRREQYFRVNCGHDNDCMFGGCGLEWHGVMDLVRLDLPSDRVKLWDYKHTTYFKARYFDSHKNGFQFPGYVWALAHLMPETMPDAVLDLLHVLKGSENFERETFRYSAARIIEWRENVKNIIRQIEEKFRLHSHEPWMWTQNRGACLDKWPCDYAPVHIQAPDIEDTRLMILEQTYDEDTYDASKALDRGEEL